MPPPPPRPVPKQRADLMDAVLISGGVRFLSGREDEATQWFARYDGDRARLREYALRMAEAGILPVDRDTMARVLDAT